MCSFRHLAQPQSSVVEGDPELPGTVQSFAPDLLAWSLLIVGVWLLLQQLVRSYRSWSARRPTPRNPAKDADALLDQLEHLTKALSNTSVDQKREAMLLAHLIRATCSERWGLDCAALTDSELLQEAEAPQKECDPQAFEILPTMLALSSNVLFAGRLFEDPAWADALNSLKDWIASTTEVPKS